MSLKDRRDISKIINRTNFKILAWYFSPRDSAICGLKRVKLAYKMPMQTSGKQKFTVYVFFKTERYDPEDPWSDSDSDYDDKDESDDEEEEADKSEAESDSD